MIKQDNSYRLDRVFMLVLMLAIMLLACAPEPAITGARDAAETCAISLVAVDAVVDSLEFVGGFGGHWSASGTYNNGLNVFAISFTLEPCTQVSIDTQ